MKKIIRVFAVVFAFSTIAHAQQSQKENSPEERKADAAAAQGNKEGEAKLPVFFVQTTHTDKECKTATSEMVKSKAGILDKMYFGCAHGNHTIYSILTGINETAVRSMLPLAGQKSAVINPVDKFNMVQIDALHKK